MSSAAIRTVGAPASIVVGSTPSMLAPHLAVLDASRLAHGPVVDGLVGVHEVAVAHRHLAQGLPAVELVVLVELVERRPLPGGPVEALQAALLDHPEQAVAVPHVDAPCL